MGKNAKSNTKKDKVVKEKVKSSPAGTYLVEKLVDGQWTEPETIKSNGRRNLMRKLGGYKFIEKREILVNLKPQVRVRVA